MTRFDENVSDSLNITTFRDFLNKTYLVLCLGLILSAAFAYLGSVLILVLPATAAIAAMVIAIIAELVVAFTFTGRLMKMSRNTAWICYLLYSALTGISLSFVIMSYTASSVIQAFLSAAVLFACMAMIGYTTKLDLSRFGTMFLAGLVATLITSLLNIFLLHSSTVSLGLCYFGIILFLGLIAYDMQRLKDLYQQGLYDSVIGEKLLIYGAFQLYLDFINLFLRLLRLFGRRRD